MITKHLSAAGTTRHVPPCSIISRLRRFIPGTLSRTKCQVTTRSSSSSDNLTSHDCRIANSCHARSCDRPLARPTASVHWRTRQEHARNRQSTPADTTFSPGDPPSLPPLWRQPTGRSLAGWLALGGGPAPQPCWYTLHLLHPASGAKTAWDWRRANGSIPAVSEAAQQAPPVLRTNNNWHPGFVVGFLGGLGLMEQCHPGLLLLGVGQTMPVDHCIQCNYRHTQTHTHTLTHTHTHEYTHTHTQEYTHTHTFPTPLRQHPSHQTVCHQVLRTLIARILRTCWRFRGCRVPKFPISTLQLGSSIPPAGDGGARTADPYS